MKSTDILKTMALCLAAMVIGSCGNDDEEKLTPVTVKDGSILGTWKQQIVNGESCLTNLRSVKTFYADGTEIVSNSKYSEGKAGWMWSNKDKYLYSFDGNFILENKPNTEVSFKTEIIEGSRNTIVYNKTNNTPDFKGDRNSSGVLVKVDDNYFAYDIIGIWQGIEMTGYETYGDANHIINFRADGEYIYFVMKDGKWVPSANVDNEYNVHGDWLATRWRPEYGKDFNYEWWDIDYIKDGFMKWSALREKEDGTRYVTTFIWKKVSDINM